MIPTLYPISCRPGDRRPGAFIHFYSVFMQKRGGEGVSCFVGGARLYLGLRREKKLSNRRIEN